MGAPRCFERNRPGSTRRALACNVTQTGAPVLVDASHTSSIAKLLGLPADHRDEGTYATSVLAALHGVEFARVHDVAGNLRAVRVAEAVAAVRPRRSDAPHGGKGSLLS